MWANEGPDQGIRLKFHSQGQVSPVLPQHVWEFLRMSSVRCGIQYYDPTQYHPGMPQTAYPPDHPNPCILSIPGYPVPFWYVPRWHVCLNTPILEYLVSRDTQYHPGMSLDGMSTWTPQSLNTWYPGIPSTILGCPQTACPPEHLNPWILSIPGYSVPSWDVPRWHVHLNTPILEYLVS